MVRALEGNNANGAPAQRGPRLLLDRGEEAVEVEIKPFDRAGFAHWTSLKVVWDA
jgi:hypothetical protein